MKRLLGYMARGNRGTTLHLTDPDKPPRGQILEKMGRRSARKIYRDKQDGTAVHVGYIVAGEWFTVYEVREWNGKVA
jgi:hypothetical protein